MNELTIIEVLEKTKIPAMYQQDLEEYPHVKEFFTILKKGHAEKALKFYEFFIQRKEFYLTKAGITNARTKRGNKRLRRNYGSNWSKKMNKQYRPTLYKKQNGLCNACFKWFYETSLEVDHIQKVTEGGKSNDYKNMQLLCEKCHDEKDNYKKGSIEGFTTGKNGTPWITR